jgi:adenylosuccinate lyase
MRAERLCGLARYLMTLPASAAQTAATQWLERTLDDSVNRRLTLPGAFLTADAVLGLALNLAGSLQVNEDVVRRNVDRIFPYMATEEVLMQASASGRDRQEVHEVIRRHAHAVTAALKAGAARNDLLDRLAADPALAGVDFEAVRRQGPYAGRAAAQVDEFLAGEVEPIRRRYPQLLGQKGDVRV